MITCKYIGHATTLITMGEANVLTDPHFSKHTFFLRRRSHLAYNPSELPPLAAILLSHTHPDHLNLKSYKYVSQRVPIVVPEGCSGAISKFVTNPIIELALFATYQLPDGTKITSVPTKHRGGVFSQFRYTTAGSYLIQKNNDVVFFCGDSAYDRHFAEIADLADIKLAILPIGSYSPRFIMKNRHMTPAEAIKAFADLKAKHMIPIHWGSFTISSESLSEPIKLLNKILEEQSDIASLVHIVEHGGQITFE